MKRFFLTAAAALIAQLVASAAAAEPPTFSKDIAPILFEHCSGCHRPGAIGPFSLLTYRDARQHATQIADVTRRRVMPPWKPRPGHGSFIGDRSLSASQLRLIADWTSLGTPEGAAADLPPLPEWKDGWQLGPPDLVVRMPAAYTLRPDGSDLFRTFVIRVPTAAPRFVRAIEFHPGNARAVHHANLGVDRTRSSQRLDDRDPEIGYVGGMVPDAGYPPGYMLGWTPGQQPRPSPEGMAWRLEPASDIVVQLHMQPTGKPETVQVSVGLYFTEEAPVRTPVGLRLGSETIDIAAGEAAYQFTDRYVLPVDVEVLAIQPHAHNLGRQMVASAVFPDGRTQPLIAIDDWDFRWQDVYRYTEPLVLPKGTEISTRFTYDNSAANPRNPFQPPQRIVWGQNTTDEMGDLWIQVVPRTAEDLRRLNDDISRKTHAEDLAAYSKVLETDPANPLRHDVVAMLYLQEGRSAEAITHFRASLALNQESAPTHYNLGIALSMRRAYDEAAAEFERALAIDPDYAEAHNNLGAMMHLSGRFDQAAIHYRRAAELRPDNAESYSNLGRLLTLQGKPAEAVAAFSRALALQPDAASTLSGLAWVKATAADASLRNPTEAIQLAERAAVVTSRRDASVLDALAAANAAGGRFEEAARVAQEAMTLASAAGMEPLWLEIRARLKLYEQRTPYIAR